jgi:cytochrome c-type biogenesis protein CcmF
MLNIIGTAAITAALLGALAMAVAGLAGGFTRRPAPIRAARYAAYLILGAMVVALVAMEVALLTHDFSVEYVARVGSLETPP